MTALPARKGVVVAARQAAVEARRIAIDTLDYIHSMRPETDPSITMKLAEIIRVLRDANLGGDRG